MRKLKEKLNKRIIAVCSVLMLLLGGLTLYVKNIENHVVVTEKHFYISLLDMEEAYAVDGTYARYMIADFNEDYTLGTIEDYIEEMMNDDEHIYIVSGIYATRNAENTIYEIAKINNTDVVDDDIEYMILDVKTMSVYDLHSEDLIFEDDDMVNKLNEYEDHYQALQDEYMDDYRHHKIISEEYMEKMLVDKLNCKEHNYIGIVEKDGVIYHKITVVYEDGTSETVLMNARTGEIFK